MHFLLPQQQRNTIYIGERRFPIPPSLQQLQVLGFLMLYKVLPHRYERRFLHLPCSSCEYWVSWCCTRPYPIGIREGFLHLPCSSCEYWVSWCCTRPYPIGIREGFLHLPCSSCEYWVSWCCTRSYPIDMRDVSYTFPAAAASIGFSDPVQGPTHTLSDANKDWWRFGILRSLLEAPLQHHTISPLVMLQRDFPFKVQCTVYKIVCRRC